MKTANGTVAIILAAITFCAGLYLARGVVNVPVNFRIFSQSGAPLFAGQFYAPDQHNRMAFSEGASGQGIVTVTRAGATVQPTLQDDKLQYYSLKAGDELCSDGKCSVQAKDGDLAVVDGETPWWSTRSLWIDPSSSMSIVEGMYLQAEAPDRLALVAPALGKLETRNILPGVNQIQSSELSVANTNRSAYAAAFAAILAAAIWLMVTNWSAICIAVVKVRWFAAALGAQILVQYLAVFPGMFNTDIVVHRVYFDAFRAWYSSLYMLYSTAIFPLYPGLIQAPNIIIYFCACIYLASRLIDTKHGQRIIWLFFVLQLLSPAVFAMLYSQQRIFVAGIVIFTALIVNVIGTLRTGMFSAFGFATLVVAGLLRTEYFAFLAVFAFIVWRLRGTQYFRQPATLRAGTLAGIAYVLVNSLIPSLYGESSSVNGAAYSLASSLDMARPYVDCDARRGPMVNTLDALGGSDRYCNGSPERFFWDHATKSGVENVVAQSKILRSELLASMLANPIPSLTRIGSRIGEFITQPHWQVYNRYQDRNGEGGSPGQDSHVRTADRAGITVAYAWQPPLANAVIGFYSALGKLPLNAIWLAFIIVVVPLLFRDWRIQILNLTVLAIVVLAAFASPAVNWSYILILPLWGLLVIPLAHLARNPAPTA